MFLRAKMTGYPYWPGKVCLRFLWKVPCRNIDVSIFHFRLLNLIKRWRSQRESLKCFTSDFMELVISTIFFLLFYNCVNIVVIMHIICNSFLKCAIWIQSQRYIWISKKVHKRVNLFPRLDSTISVIILVCLLDLSYFCD